MKRFAVHDAATGEIKRIGACHDDDVAHQAMPGEIVMAINDVMPFGNFRALSETHYLVAGKLTRRPRPVVSAYATTPGGQIMVSNLPPGNTRVAIDGAETVVPDSSVVIQLDDPGDYALRVGESFPHRPLSATIKVRSP